MLLSLGQAAKLANVGKTTLARAIKAGRLSATRRDDGGYQIEVSELERVYTLRAPGDVTGATDGATGHPVQDATGAALAAEVAALREMLAMMREQAADLRDDRDRWRECAERLTIAAPKPAAAPDGDSVTAPGSRVRRVWKWLRTTG